MRRNVYSTCDIQLPNDKKYVAVNLLSEDTLYFVVEIKSKVNELFTQVCKFLSLYETELFGLSIKTESYLFLDPTQKLCKYAPKQWKIQNNGVDNSGKSLFGVYFRVQFYVDSYLFISDKVAKLLYYLQLRENVVNYGQALCEERAFLLASYALQADFGNFNPEIHVGQYFNPHHYFPSWVIEEMGLDYIIRHSPFLHRDHKGMHKTEAQSMYIKEASDASAPHNLHLYKLKNKRATTDAEVWLGICTTGVEINAEEERISSSHSHTHTKQKNRISFFAWADIGKLYFEKKKFEIRSTVYPVRKFTYYASSEDMARHLLWLCKVTHQFQLVVQSKMKEVKRRESELYRKKFRESYINCETFELPVIGRNKKGSDFNNSPSVCEETGAQRVSVISNASSNTTSGIVSDKVQSLEDSDRDDIDIEIMVNSPPVVSLESLALSEPTEGSITTCAANIKDKHSISISNITMSSNCCNANKQQSDNDMPSSANSIKSTSSDRSNITVKSVIPSNMIIPSVIPSANKQIINIVNKSNNNLIKDLDNNNMTLSTKLSLSPNNESTSVTSLNKQQHSANLSAKVEQQQQQYPDLSVRSVNLSKLTERSESMNHIYENIPFFSQYRKLETKPKQILKASPSLCSALSTTPQRTTTRIGVSSLTRTHNKPTLSVFNHNYISNTNKNLSIAGSEPNLYNSKLWSTPSYLLQSSNCSKLPLSDDLNNWEPNPYTQDSNSYKDNIIGKVPNIANPQIILRNSKETRAYSDPPYHYTTPTLQSSSSPSPVNPNSLSCTDRVVECTPPSFHQSLNNIAITTPHPLRLVGSDINVNINSNIQSICIPPPPDYANSLSENRAIKSANNSHLIISQKGNSNLNRVEMNGNISSKNYINEQNGSISDLQQLRQKSRDLNLPLITALFNDRTLMMLPKTVPCSRQRHISTARDIRRYSCSSDICSDIANRHISTIPSKKLDTDLTLPKINLTNRPTSWHLEYPNKHIWEQYRDQQSQQNELHRATADFIDQLWAEHQLTT